MAWEVASVTKRSDKQHKTQDCWQTSAIGKKHQMLPAGLMRKSDLNYPETYVITVIQSIATTILQTRNTQFCRTGWLRLYTCLQQTRKGKRQVVCSWHDPFGIHMKWNALYFISLHSLKFVDFYIALLLVVPRCEGELFCKTLCYDVFHSFQILDPILAALDSTMQLHDRLHYSGSVFQV